MATSYKYIAREAEDQINWAEVGANLTNTLKEENRVREEKKGAIDAASREYSNILNNVEQGQNTELNKFALNSLGTYHHMSETSTPKIRTIARLVNF